MTTHDSSSINEVIDFSFKKKEDSESLPFSPIHHSFVALEEFNGAKTHYHLLEPNQDSRGLLVCITGIRTAMTVFESLAYKLLEKTNFTILRLDLFGRGFSDFPPERPHNDQYFARQVYATIKTLGNHFLFIFYVSLIYFQKKNISLFKNN
eukprot:gb/GECH01008332.1/.p1 GENE.gb/GECH01008332.1/~~gb/GECH01008332.1/.p1  ORF type:complete len:151 (+),score=33.52 gb/GECH01008332.1/:1-453(+)